MRIGTTPNTQFWVVPRTPTTHGVLYFGFGRGEYPKDGIALSPRVQEVLQGKLDQLNALAPEDLYGIPQQGVTEKGLFLAVHRQRSSNNRREPVCPSMRGRLLI